VGAASTLEVLMTKLSDAKLVVLSAAAQRDDRLAAPPKLPVAAAAAVGRSLLRAGLVETASLPGALRAAFGWTLERGSTIALRITDAGLRAIGVEPVEAAPVADAAPTGVSEPTTQDLPTEPAEANRAAPATSLREAGTALLHAWDTLAARGHSGGILGHDDGVAAAIAQLRAVLTTKPSREPRAPREGTKQQAVLTLLRRPEGATIAQIIDATAWQPHTVRGFLAGLKRRGVRVEVLERVRQVGPNRDGAKGSYSVYRVTE